MFELLYCRLCILSEAGYDICDVQSRFFGTIHVNTNGVCKGCYVNRISAVSYRELLTGAESSVVNSDSLHLCFHTGKGLEQEASLTSLYGTFLVL